MNGTILLFGFEDLPSIAAMGGVAERFGAKLVPVLRPEYNKTLGVLAGVTKDRSAAMPYAGGPLGGRMLVLCGLENKLDDLLSAIRQEGIGADCLKAVLTPHNRDWTVLALYAELQAEHRAFQKKR